MFSVLVPWAQFTAEFRTVPNMPPCTKYVIANVWLCHRSLRAIQKFSGGQKGSPCPELWLKINRLESLGPAGPNVGCCHLSGVKELCGAGPVPTR